MKKHNFIIKAICAACLMPLMASAELYNIQLAGYTNSTYSGAAYVGTAGDIWNNPDWTGVYTGSTNLFTGVAVLDSSGADNGVTATLTALYNTNTTNWNTGVFNHYSGKTGGSATPSLMDRVVKSDYSGFVNVHTLVISGLPADSDVTVYAYGSGDGAGQGSAWALDTANTNGGVDLAYIVYDDSATGRDVTLGTSEGTGWGRLEGTTDGSGNLTVTATAGNGSVWWQTYMNGIQVDVGNSAITAPIISGLDDVTSFLGFDITLAPIVSGIPDPTYQWQLGGSDLAGETNATLSLANLQLSQSGNVYTLIASNTAGSDTNSMTLTVLEPNYGTGRYNIQLNGYTTPTYAGAGQIGTTNDVWNSPEWVGVGTTSTVVFAGVTLLDSASNAVSITASLESTFNDGSGWGSGTFNRYSGQTAGSATPDLMDHVVKMDYDSGASQVNVMTFTLDGLPAGSNVTVYAYGSGNGEGSGGTWTLSPTNTTTNGISSAEIVASTNALGRDITVTNSQGTAWEVLTGVVDPSGSLTVTIGGPSSPAYWWQVYMNGIQVEVGVPASTGPTVDPVIDSIVVSGTDVTLTWTDEGVGTYTIQRKTDMTATNWADVLGGLPAGLGSTNVTASGADQEFYQIKGE